jgi:cytochrome c biogenesis protein ResB
VPVEIDKEIPLGDNAGSIKIVKSYENLKIGMDEGKTTYFEDPSPGSNPALEVQITSPSGQTSTQHVFERFPGHSHGQDKFLLSYHRVIRDYISELQIIENNKVVAEKDIEVNHPLRFGGYHFYQSSYDDKAEQYTVLQVVSDTGLYVVYAGYWMLCIGVIWHMWLRHIFSRSKTKST